MSNREGGDFAAFVSGFIVGGLVGAAVALLFAPQSGEETRTLIRDKGIELKEQVEQSAADARAAAQKVAKDAKAKAEELQARGQQILGEQKERLERAVDAGKKAAKAKRSEIEGPEAAPEGAPETA